MNVTETRISLFEKQGSNLKAFVSITFDFCLAVKDLTVMTGKNGLFVKWPSKKVGEEYQDIIFPVNKEFRLQVQDRVLTDYEQQLGKKRDTSNQDIPYSADMF